MLSAPSSERPIGSVIARGSATCAKHLKQPPQTRKREVSPSDATLIIPHGGRENKGFSESLEKLALFERKNEGESCPGLALTLFSSLPRSYAQEEHHCASRE